MMARAVISYTFLRMRPLLLFLLLASALPAQEIRPVPPPGVAVPDADRKELEAALARLKSNLARLKDNPLYADVRIFHDAVHFALTYNEFLKPDEIFRGKELLRQGEERADALLRGDAPWTRQTGLVVRGYISRIDESAQPYGLVIPENWSPGGSHNWRLDAWFHGRSETLTEVNFLWERQRNPGQFTPPDTIVIHLYGRYCNANKMAGEVDWLEALADMRKKYRIDENRIAVRGFSMGGAAVWHFAAHYAGRWAAAAPGAGFAETAEFLRVFQNEKVQPAWWEQKLWRLYDATEYAANFFNLPLVAYSGEIDRQKQAADIMAAALLKEGIPMTHIIGPQTPHRYHPDSIAEINRRIDAIMARGRDPFPRKLKFVTHTLRYNRMKWLVLDALEKHWEPARIEAELTGGRGREFKTSNVAAFTLDFPAGAALAEPSLKIALTIDGQPVESPGPQSDLSWRQSFVKNPNGEWTPAAAPPSGLRKRHGLQGPIDDAFWNRFLIVKPTDVPLHPKTGEWAEAEMNRAIREWRRHFRGEALVKSDADVTDADIASSNLVLWGDPQSNKILARIAGQLPVRWTRDSVSAGQAFPAATHALIAVYPNPLNPNKYVVLNSGFTFREYDYLNNARQVPKLPDYAIVDVTTPPDARFPGKIALAGFFGEKWELQPGHGK